MTYQPRVKSSLPEVSLASRLTCSAGIRNIASGSEDITPGLRTFDEYDYDGSDSNMGVVVCLEMVALSVNP